MRLVIIGIGIVAIAVIGFLVFRTRKGSGGGAPTAGDDDSIDV